MKPRYRDDIKGEVRAFKADFADSIHGEITNSEDGFLLFCWEDLMETNAWREYADYLTEAELKKITNKVLRDL